MDITIEQISKRFSGTPALAGVSLTIRSGELIALLGPSGSGKTTLLRVIAGLEPASSGRVLFGGEDATRVPVQRRGVGFVFQHYALFRHMTVAGNIAYGLKVRERARRPKRAEIDERVRVLLRLVQLEGLEARYPTQLSGGQRQRIALARALAVEPRVLLLDEPFGALDAKVRRDLRRWLRDIHERTGVTTVFVTHDQDEALELADRVAVMREGRIEQVGTPDEIHDAPANSFVMRFIGDTSHLDVELRDGAVWREGLRLPVEASGQGPKASLHLRPWDMRLVEAGGLAGRVVAVRRTGAGRRAEIRLGETSDLVEVEIEPAATTARGDAVRVEVLRGRLFPHGEGLAETPDRE